MTTQAPAAVNEARANAMMLVLQQQRDSAVNQVVILTGDLAVARDELQRQKALFAENDARTAEACAQVQMLRAQLNRLESGEK